MNEQDFLGNQSWKMQCCIILFLVYRNKLGGSLGTRLTGNTKKREHPEIEMQLMSGKLT